LRVLAAVRDSRLLARISQLTWAIHLRLFADVVLPNPLPIWQWFQNSIFHPLAVTFNSRGTEQRHLKRHGAAIVTAGEVS
jgi:hypothetical protein